jgi:hypothetical protein
VKCEFCCVVSRKRHFLHRWRCSFEDPEQAERNRNGILNALETLCLPASLILLEITDSPYADLSKIGV